MKAPSATAAFVMTLSLSACGFDVMYADWKVDRLCKVDGGNTIYSHDVLPDSLLLANGNIDVMSMERGEERASHYLKYNSTEIEYRDPSITRLEGLLIRRRDGEVLGKSVVYIRPMQNTGIPLLHRSAHSCPPDGPITGMVYAVFQRERR